MLAPVRRNPEILTSIQNLLKKSGPEPDDGKRLRACEKRLELHSKAKPKIGGVWGEAPARLGAPTDDGKFQGYRGSTSIKNRS